MTLPRPTISVHHICISVIARFSSPTRFYLMKMSFRWSNEYDILLLTTINWLDPVIWTSLILGVTDIYFDLTLNGAFAQGATINIVVSFKLHAQFTWFFFENRNTKPVKYLNYIIIFEYYFIITEDIIIMS